jgi:hypothetical protein
MSGGIDPFAALHSILLRVSMLLMWTVFALFHVTLAVLFLLCAWATKADPGRMLAKIEDAYLGWHLSTFLAVLAAFGGSITLLLLGYVWAWRRLYGAFVIPYVFKDVDEAFRQQRK